ncbi:MAG: methyltransferase domain-containing protein [Candidatus Aegiribacteria sp.]|nr:methyltransferase domain-containing protein [Candidatus Aegiribacteria sp.]
MPADWMNVSSLSFNTILLFERVQLSWFPGWIPEKEFAVALRANPHVEWYLRHKCPELNEWLDKVTSREDGNQPSNPEIRQAEMEILKTVNDLVVYVVSPDVYDSQPFLKWNPDELTSLIDFSGKRVIDIGSGTGKLALIAASKAKAVYAVEPVANLRIYLKKRTMELGLNNVFVVDGLIQDIPFADDFADITIGGFVFGEHPDEELREMMRVTKPCGTVILCPGNTDSDNDKHDFLIGKGFEWSQFKEPGVRPVRKYWKKVRP